MKSSKSKIMINQFKDEVLKLKNKDYIDKKIIEKFLWRVNLGNLTKEENPYDHFCSFFLPFDIKTKYVFIGHHIKADDWIPPGGHIAKNENPCDTVVREFYEELDYKLKNEKIKLFDISVIPVRKTKRRCKIHYDLWYLVFMDKVNFSFDKKEFYDAQWIKIENAPKMIKRYTYKNIVKKLIELN